MINNNLAKNVLKHALSTGGDFAEIFLENKSSRNISVINGKLDSVMSGIDYGVGIRIFCGLNSVYAYTNKRSESDLIEVAKSAADAVHKKNTEDIVINFAVGKASYINHTEIAPKDVSKKSIVEILRKASEISFGCSLLVTQTRNHYYDEIQDVVIINSEGLWTEDRRVRSKISISSVASVCNEKQMITDSIGIGKGFVPEGVDIESMAKRTANTALVMLEAAYAPKGLMTVIINKASGGIIFHEACGHGLEANYAAKKTSEFHDKLEKQIASSKITAVDDGTIPDAWGSLNIDDEGAPTQKNILIENGILKSFLVDKLNGLKMGVKSTGSGRRQSYKFAPTSRMTNTYIEAGTDREEDILKDTEYGLYAKELGGGSVNPTTGGFNFAVTEAYIVKNGQISHPVRGASLIGKGSDVLCKIDKVANDATQTQGICGGISGLVPTNLGQPMIRVTEMVVGGRS